ncbi:MAG: MOSC domain-containing protein [Myxococcales bacterium]|nr:MOSC domain-containing protein [Myxococcales bacterium]
MTSVDRASPSFAALEEAWSAQDGARTGAIELLVARLGGGDHRCLTEAELCPERGLIGDRWERGEQPSLGRQITLMDVRVAQLVCAGKEMHLSGDNLLVDLDLSEVALPVGSDLRVGSVCLRVTQEPHRGCKIFAARFGLDALKWVNWRAHRPRRLRGVNCQVITGGTVEIGDCLRR